MQFRTNRRQRSSQKSFNISYGPVPSSGLPSRPKFAWDSKSAPWTDGKLDQEQYNESVTSWNAFHDVLPDSKNNKIPKKLRMICLKYPLSGRVKDLCTKRTNKELLGDDGVQKITDAVYQRDALSVVSEELRAFNLQWNTHQSNTESK